MLARGLIELVAEASSPMPSLWLMVLVTEDWMCRLLVENVGRCRSSVPTRHMCLCASEENVREVLGNMFTICGL